MPLAATIAICVCLGVLTVLLALQARKTGEWRAFYFEFAALVVFVFFLRILFGFPALPERISGKGGAGELMLAAFLGICMVLGMLAQFLYRHFEQPQGRRPRWDWGMFIAPLFASPIVFIPLLVAFDGANIDLNNLTAARSVIFFVAFQNG